MLAEAKLDDRYFFPNSTDNNAKFVKGVLENPYNNRKQLLPNEAYEIVDGRFAVKLEAAKMYILLQSKVFFSQDLQKEIEAETRINCIEKSQYESIMRTNSFDNLKITVLHNPEKDSELVTGEKLSYEVVSETRDVEVYNGTRMTTKRVLEKNEYFLIS